MDGLFNFSFLPLSMPIHEKDLQSRPEIPKIFSEDFHFEHEGIKYLSRFQIPSKLWLYWNQTTNLFHGSQSDSSGVVSESRAKDMLIRHNQETKEAQGIRSKRPVVKDSKI